MKELTLAAVVENIPEVTAFVDAQLEMLDCPARVQMQIEIAIDELFGNIAHYAYAPGVGDATVRFDFDEDTRTVRLTFLDSGIPYNPLEQDDPDVTLSAQERKVGGLGVFLVKKTMDGMNYERRGDLNILSIQKAI